MFVNKAWVNVGHSVFYQWKDKTVSVGKDDFMQGLSPGCVCVLTTQVC